MGADIQLVVEASFSADFSNPRGIAFTTWPRQSELFSAMAGIYNSICLIPARGFPEPASSLAYSHYGLHIIADDDFEAALAMPSIIETDALQALKENNSCKLSYIKDFISNPTYTSASWLTRPEFFQALEFNKIDQSILSLESVLTIKLLEEIERHNQHARMVFWFDL